MDPRLDSWLSVLHAEQGTDILLTVASPPLLRIDGSLAPLADTNPLTDDAIRQIATTLLGEVGGDSDLGRREVDLAFSWNGTDRIRGNVFRQRNSCAISLRRIPLEIPSPVELGLPTALSRLLRNPSGLILVTGPTGSGKSTSMASMVDVVNRSRACHIVTIEDPIEYLHPNRLSAVSQREVGTDTESFESGLRSVLREDPDVVLIGEMRDLESISSAVSIAETGHVVITTLHTNDSAQAIDRIIDAYPADRRHQIQMQLASTLLAVLYQRLVPRIGGGLVAAYELMVGTPAVRNLIREGKTRQLRNILTTHRSDGMQTLEQSLSQLLEEGVISYESALDASLYPQDIVRPGPAVPANDPRSAA
ncbi:MAG: PilT/PilU family type 4a pilus ATPase [Acidobacteriota bacterium]|nr:PilT/PilU family type 4a pilus ATPase [Acidobacteriota bacterium]